MKLDIIILAAVPGKTHCEWCVDWGSYMFANWGWHTGVNASDSIFTFLDGHAEIYEIQSFNVFCLAVGSNVGVPYDQPGGWEQYAFTYPHEMNHSRSIAAAEWWVRAH